MLHSKSMAVAALLAGSVGAQNEDTAPPPPVELTFGVYATDRPTVIYRQFVPMIEALQTELTHVLQRPASIEVKIYKTYESAQDALVKGEVDFVRFGPSSYILSKARQPKISLLAMEDNDGEKVFQGMIVVRADSPIRELKDLRGKKFAFGDESSTIGRYLAQLELVNAGITAKDLASYSFLGRHDKVFSAVELKDFDAGAVKENTFDKMNTKGTLRVLKRFKNVTKPWVARAGLDPVVVEGLRKSLLALKSDESLSDIGVTGFRAVADKDYDGIRKAMPAAERFLKAVEAAPAPGNATPSPGK